MRQVAVLLLAIALAACSSPSPIQPDRSLPTLPPTTPLPGGVLVVFNREGGFVYSNKTLTVRADGTAFSGFIYWKIPEDKFESLTALLNDPDLAAMTVPSDPIGSCSDCYVYTINALTPQGVKTIQVDDADLYNSPPTLLVTTIDLLTELLAP